MELTRYGASHVVLPGTGPLPGYGSAPWVWVRSLGMVGMGHLHAMCWSSVTLSAKLGKVVSRSLPSSSRQSSRFVYRNADGGTAEC